MLVAKSVIRSKHGHDAVSGKTANLRVQGFGFLAEDSPYSPQQPRRGICPATIKVDTERRLKYSVEYRRLLVMWDMHMQSPPLSRIFWDRHSRDRCRVPELPCSLTAAIAKNKITPNHLQL